MATKKQRSDEGGSGAETKGRVPEGPDETDAEGPHGDTDIERDLEELEREELTAGSSRRRARRGGAGDLLGGGGRGRSRSEAPWLGPGEERK
jgi:hypothetical protein